jgi:glycosyltransferase involved in cell wall biosynthesis
MIHTDGIARELVKRGHEVDIIIQESNDKPQFKDITYKLISIPGNTYSILGQIKFQYGLFKLLKNRKYDVIHAKNPFSSVLPAILNRNEGKVIYDVRGLWIDFGVHAETIPKNIAYFLSKIDMLCMRKADKVIAISYELKNILIKRGLNQEKIDVIIGDGVDSDKIKYLKKKDMREFLGIEGQIIGYVGSIGSSRHSERIIEAFKIVHEKINSTKLVLVGPCKEDDLKYLKKIVNENGLENEVLFTGFIPHDEALSIMKAFDIAVSYHDENLPIYNVAIPTKILEYLASGCSIVTTDHKMYQNLLTHKKDGYFTAQDPKSFGEGIIYLLENEEISKNISKNTLTTAEKLSFKKVVDQVEKVYERVLRN